MRLRAERVRIQATGVVATSPDGATFRIGGWPQALALVGAPLPPPGVANLEVDVEFDALALRVDRLRLVRALPRDPSSDADRDRNFGDPAQ